MLIQSPKQLCFAVVTAILCTFPMLVVGQEQKQPQYKDQAEYDLYNSILQDQNPKTKLEKLQQWETKYPSTEFVKPRRTLLLTTYIAAGQPKEAVAVAKKTLADDPKDFNALYYTMLLTRSLYAANQQASILDDGEKTSNAILASIDTAPEGVTAEQWAKLRPDIELLAHVTLGFIGMQRKSWDAAEAELKKTLQLKPDNSEVDYLMAVTQANKKNNSVALYYYARAAAFDGAGSFAAAQRQSVLAEVQKMYGMYHGSPDGLNELLASAKTAPNPPEGFHIKSKSEILKEKYATDEAAAAQFAKDHPELALWKTIKEALTGPTGATYFNDGMKERKVLTLKGKVVKLEPAVRPKTILVALDDGASDGTSADATLKFEAPLPGKVEPGTEISFEGVPETYTAAPLMVVFNVEKDDLHGWTGKNAPGPAHRPVPKGKSSAKK